MCSISILNITADIVEISIPHIILEEMQINDTKPVNTLYAAKNEESMHSRRERLHKQRKYQGGRLVITQVLHEDTYKVVDLRQEEPGRKYASTAHASQLKIWRP